MPLSQPLVCPVLIGRDAFLKALAELRARTEQGAGRVVLISGEAGIGKSRLLAEMRSVCLASGWHVLEGNCFEHDQAVPYSAWSDLFRRAFSGTGKSEALRALGRSGTEIVRLLPELGDLTGSQAAQSGLDPQQQRQRLIAEVGSFLHAYTATAPLAVIIEDIHWADESSLDLLAHLARSAPSARLLLVVSYRSDEISETLGALLAELDRLRVATELTLDRLEAGEVREMLGATLGPVGQARPDFAQTVFSLTEGNPFFIEEVLRSVQPEAGAAWTPADLSIPRSVREAVRRRFRNLGESARRVAEYAAVAGRRFDFAVLSRICEVEEARLLECVKELIGAQLIVEEAADQFSFRHALTREAIYSALLARERRSLHGQIANTLEEMYADTPTKVAADLAYHFFEAEDWPKTLHHAAVAAAEADSVYAPRASVEQYSRAIFSAGKLAQAPSPHLLRGRAAAYDAIGDFDRARSDLEKALTLARESSDRNAEWQALLDLGLLWAARDYTRTGEYYRQAFLLAEALGDDLMRARSMNQLGNWHVNVEEPVESLSYHRRALEIFERLQDKRGIADTLDLVGLASMMGGDLEGSIQSYRKAVTLFRELDDKVRLASALATMSVCGRSNYHNQTMIQTRFSFSDAAACAAEALAISRAIGLRSAESFCLWNHGMMVGAQGHYSEALSRTEEGLAIAEEIGHKQWMCGAHYVLGCIYQDILQLNEAASHLASALDLARETGTRFWAKNSSGFLASTQIAGGDTAGASQTIDAILSEDLPAGTIGERLLWAAKAELGLALGKPDAAFAALDRLREFEPSGSPGPRGVRYTLLRGRALRVAGSPELALEELWSASHEAESEGSRGQLWRLLLETGSCLSDLGRDNEAASAFDRAAGVILELAAEVPEQWREPFLSRAATGFPPAAAARLRRRPATGGGSSPLTPRERAVAGLVAQGMSNRGIADELVLSERTVETHVSNILSKLGFSSRAQIAAWAVENRIEEQAARA